MANKQGSAAIQSYCIFYFYTLWTKSRNYVNQLRLKLVLLLVVKISQCTGEAIGAGGAGVGGAGSYLVEYSTPSNRKSEGPIFTHVAFLHATF